LTGALAPSHQASLNNEYVIDGPDKPANAVNLEEDELDKKLNSMVVKTRSSEQFYRD
jgi:hypothetical protein